MAGGTYSPNFPGGPSATQTTVVAGSGGANINGLIGTLFTLTPTASETLTANVLPAGSEVYLVITTSGTTSFTLTFGTGFRSQGTLATGTVSAARFVVTFISDGVTLNEEGRTTAM